MPMTPSLTLFLRPPDGLSARPVVPRMSSEVPMSFRLFSLLALIATQVALIRVLWSLLPDLPTYYW